MAGSAAAAAASLGILLPELPGPAAFLYKVFTCCAAVAAAYGVPGLQFCCSCVCVVSAAEPAAVRSRAAARSAKRKSLRLSAAVPGAAAAVLRCSACRAARRTVLLWPCRHRCVAALELEGAALSVQAFCDTGFSVQDPLTGRAVVLSISRRAQRLAAGAAHISGPLFLPAAALRRRSCGCGWCPAPPLPGTACCLPFRSRPCAPAKAVQPGHSGRILPPGNTAAMDSSAWQRTGRTAGHPLSV